MNNYKKISKCKFCNSKPLVHLKNKDYGVFCTKCSDYTEAVTLTEWENKNKEIEINNKE